MVTPRTCIVIPGDRAWRLAVVEGQALHAQSVDVTAGALGSADAVRAAMRSLGYTGDSVVVALPSAWCLAAAIDTAALPRRARADALAYALEEKLPVSADESVAGFIETAGHALGVAVPLDRLTPLLTTLDAFGLRAQAIAPAALLALEWGLLDRASSHTGLVLLAGDTAVDIFTLQRGRPVAWSLVPADPRSVRRGVQMLTAAAGDAPPCVLAVGIGEDVTASFSEISGVQLQQIPARPLDELAAIGGSVAAHRRFRSWIDLLPALRRRRGESAAGGGWRAVLAATLLVSLAIPGAILWRAYRYDAAAAEYRRVQQVYYQQHFPGPAPAVGISRIFESELKAAARAAAPGASLGHDSALWMLHDALRSVPEEARLRLTRLRVTADRAEIQGEAATKSDVYAAQQALGQMAGLAAEITRIEDAAAGGGGAGECRFTLVARPAAAPPKEPAP